jgi:hypothetical protein
MTRAARHEPETVRPPPGKRAEDRRGSAVLPGMRAHAVCAENHQARVVQVTLASFQGGDIVNRDDLFDPRTDRERAADYLHRKRPARPKAPEQTAGLFDEPARQQKHYVTPEPTDANALFDEPQHVDRRRLVPVNGWPDHRAVAT